MKINTWQEIRNSYTPEKIEGDRFAQSFLEFIAVEEKVAAAGNQGSINVYTNGQIPGLLQTSQYAKGLMISDHERHTAIRMARARLVSASGVAMNFLVEREGLDLRVASYVAGGRAAAIDEQLHYLVDTLEEDMAGANQIDFRLVPRQEDATREHLKRDHICLLDDGKIRYGFQDSPRADTGWFIEQLNDVEVTHQYQLWAAAGSVALDREASLDHLRHLLP